jgi:hypothetical protein
MLPQSISFQKPARSSRANCRLVAMPHSRALKARRLRQWLDYKSWSRRVLKSPPVARSASKSAFRANTTPQNFSFSAGNDNGPTTSDNSNAVLQRRRAMNKYAVAPHDPEFEVEWLSGDNILEGSPSRGFQTVYLAGYGKGTFLKQFKVTWQELQQRKQAGSTRPALRLVHRR